ncbi:MAG: alpha/beta hydrolase [Alphaproteobacteria bacterium]|nr:alpha/beta hydrolase [Alphaproteobacteria bacterium]MDE2112151.1 alpha/beta hydrolase [Alphaproteobacteria bacterium]MDE2495782.1 alpha/beta hydrolase [Alphaproteobacteria bacterium]
MMEIFRLPSENGIPPLSVHRQKRDGAPVLYVHGASFPAALSVGYRFQGRSWMDDLNARGFDAWGLDFAGYGASARYAEMDGPQAGNAVGRAPVAAKQIARVAAFIAQATGRPRLSIIAHSWGTIPAALFAIAHPERIERLCLFGPVVERDAPDDGAGTPDPCWHLVTIAQQHARFVADVPQGHAPVLIEPELEQWGPTYLATDPQAFDREPPSVKIPFGPMSDAKEAWTGKLAYRPQNIPCPTLLVRGEWDSVTNDDDAQWLLSRITHPVRADAKIPKGTHLMHLEWSRDGLFAAVGDFLSREKE